ncbi:MAG: IS701 family transposase [Rubrobacteraceae bacterium]|nr:IS701 family transposase [Rubrobacteraceae bacterium]
MDIPRAVPKASSDPLPEISAFLESFAPLFRRVQSQQSLERYVTGLLTDLDRKNCDTISAAVAGTSTERLQHLLTDAEWDPKELDAARVGALSERSPEGGILILDDTSFPKQGKASVGVARQYCGELGKRANCQVVVSAHYVADEPESSRPLHWPVCARLYLPKGWANDLERRERAHVPEEVGFRIKPQIALSLVDLSGEWEVPFDVVVADSGYGDNPSFLVGLEEREIAYVCAVESTFGVRLPEEVRAASRAGAPPYGGRGQPPKERPSPLYTAKEVIGSVPEEAWQTVSWREGTKGTLSKQMVALRAHRATGSDRHSTTHERVSTAGEGWLIGERPLPKAGKEEEEQKYYYSSLGEEVPLERMAALAKSRWAIEQFYEDAKGECGLGDYQGRRFDGLHRHLALSMVAYSFLMLQSSVTTGTGSSSSEGVFFPLGQAHDASGYPQAGTGVAAGGPGAMVRRNRSDQDLPSS